MVGLRPIPRNDDLHRPMGWRQTFSSCAGMEACAIVDLNEGATSQSIFPPPAFTMYTICYYLTPDHLDVQIFISSNDCTRLDILLASICFVYNTMRGNSSALTSTSRYNAARWSNGAICWDNTPYKPSASLKHSRGFYNSKLLGYEL